MVKLVLHDACQVAADPFVVGLALLVQPLHMDTRGAHHLLVNGGQRQTTLFRRIGLAIVVFDDMRIDIHASEVFILRHVVAQHVEVNDNNTNGTSYLGSGQSDTLTLGQRVPHVLDKALQVGIVHRDVFGNLAKNGLAIYINR